MIEEQRDHLGAHLKNTVSKIYQITDGILALTKLARSGKIGKGTAFKQIEKLANELKYFTDVPASVSYQFSPFDVMSDADKWEKEKASSKYILTKENADKEIYPTLDDIKDIKVN